MKFSKRLVAGLSGTVLAASALMIVGASPASAVTPTGGCWVYSPTTPANIEDTVPASSSLDPGAVGRRRGCPADYELHPHLEWAPPSADARLQHDLQQGPDERWPACRAARSYYYFSVNGVEPAADHQAVHVAAGAATIPGDTITGSYTITSTGCEQTIRLRKVYYDIPTSRPGSPATARPSAPRPGSTRPTNPVDTNIAAHVHRDRARRPRSPRSATSRSPTHARKSDVISFSVANFRQRHGHGVAVQQQRREL